MSNEKAVAIPAKWHGTVTQMNAGLFGDAASTMELMLEEIAALTAEVDALKAESKMRTDQLDSTLETADREWEAHEAVYRERDELKAELARRSAPVTVAELKRHGAQGLAAVSACPAVNSLILARATPPQDVEKKRSIGFPRDKTDEWEARQDVEKS